MYSDTEREILFCHNISIIPLARRGSRGAATSEEWRRYESDLTIRLRSLWGTSRPPIEMDPLGIMLDFQLPRMKSMKKPYPAYGTDIGAYVMPVMNACLGVFWSSHNQVVELQTFKNWATTGTGITIRLERLDHADLK